MCVVAHKCGGVRTVLSPPTSTNRPSLSHFLPFAGALEKYGPMTEICRSGVAGQWVVERHANGAAAVNFGASVDVDVDVGVRSEASGEPRKLVQRRLIRQKKRWGGEGENG